MNRFLVSGVMFVAIISISGLLFEVCAETVRQPASSITVNDSIIEKDIKAPVVVAPVLRQPIVRQPVITEPGIRVVPPANPLAPSQTPRLPVAKPADASVVDDFRSRNRPQVQLQPPGSQAKAGASFDAGLKKERAEDKDKAPPVRNNVVAGSNLEDFASTVQQNNQTKSELREQMSELKDKISDMPPGPERDALENQLNDLETELATLADMQQKDMSDLQEAMNQQAQLMQMMSNMQKMMNDTAKAIVRNLK